MSYPTQGRADGSAFPHSTFERHAQSNGRDQTRGYAGSLDGRTASPQDSPGISRLRGRGSLSEMSAAAPNSSAMGHGMSHGSAGQSSYAQRNNSIDESDETSPPSLRSLGLRGLDEPAPATLHAALVDREGGEHAMASKEEEESKPPAWSDLKTKAGKERKRLPLACIACRRKKIRCSGEKPACKHCLRSRIPCVYKVAARKAAPRTDYMTMLDKRLKRMEERVIKIIPEQDPSKMARIGRAVVKPATAQSGKVATKKRIAEDAFANELHHWQQTEVGQGHPQPPSAPGSAENRLLTEGAEHLPSKELQEHLAQVYFDCLYGQSFFILHKPSYMRRLRAGTVPPVLALAVCAVAARFSSHPQLDSEPAYLRGESWAKPARDIALGRYGEPSMTTLSVLLILALHEFGTCNGGRSWMLTGMAIRMAFALQLHRELAYDPYDSKHDKASELSFTDREIRRRAMWACFQLDRFNASGAERPTMIDEENIKIQLPIRESYFQMEIPGPTEDLDGRVPNPIPHGEGRMSNPKDNMGVNAYFVKTVALWNRVTNYLNRGGKEKDRDPWWDPASGFAHLQAEVMAFGDDFPARLKYCPETLQNYTAQKKGNQFLLLHIGYNQVVLFLHKFALEASSRARPPKDMPKDFINNAAKTAIDAASQISSLLNDGSGVVLAAPFAGYCAFLSSTAHIWGKFSKNPQLEKSSTRDLTYNVKYLRKMKKHWGMFHFIAENLKEIYHEYAEAASKGISAGIPSHDGGIIFEYNDWLPKYPYAFSKPDHEDQVALKPEAETGTDPALSQKPDLQSVEEYFSAVSSLEHSKFQRKVAKRGSKEGSNPSKAPFPIKTELIQQQQQLPAHSSHQHQPLHDAPTQTPSQSSPHPLPLHHQTLASPHGHQPYGHAQFPGSLPNAHLPYGTPYVPPHPAPTQEIDRQLVFSAYAGADLGPNIPMPGFAASGTTGLWGTGEGLDFHGGVGGGVGGAEIQGWGDPGSSAWFTPFNLQPPDAGTEHGFFNVDGFAAEGGVGGAGIR